MSEFYKGQKIVCVDDCIKPEFLIEASNLYPNWVQRDKTYKVRRVLHNDGIATGLLLEGVSNPPVFIPLLKRVQEPAFAEWRFVPLLAQMDEEEIEILNEDLIEA